MVEWTIKNVSIEQYTCPLKIQIMLGCFIPTGHRGMALLEVFILLSYGNRLLANLTQSDVPLTVALMQVE